jgi:histidine phosphotransferase ChpT
LLCSRVCHDIISPVGAINNGLELLEEGGSDEDAMQLIRASAVNASARLQFARLAFGAAGSAGMQIDTGDAQNVATAFIRNEKPELEWIGARALLPKNKVKLLLNLILIANGAIPRGGKITVQLDDLDTAPKFTLVATGRWCASRRNSWSCIRGRNRKSRSTHTRYRPTTLCFWPRNRA